MGVWNCEQITNSLYRFIVCLTLALFIFLHSLLTGGCTALANIAGGEAGGDNRVAVADCGGLHAILKAVQTFPQDETVLRSAYQALRSLGYNPTQELERAQQLQEQEQSADDDDDMSEGGGGD